MLCSNAEGASLKGCNFEDPSGLKANLEGKLLPVNYSMGTALCLYICVAKAQLCLYNPWEKPPALGCFCQIIIKFPVLP